MRNAVSVAARNAIKVSPLLKRLSSKPLTQRQAAQLVLAAPVGTKHESWSELQSNPFFTVSAIGYVCVPAIPSTVAFTNGPFRASLIGFAAAASSKTNTDNNNDDNYAATLCRRIHHLLRVPCCASAGQSHHIMGSWIALGRKWRPSIPPYHLRNPQNYINILSSAFYYFVHMPINVMTLEQLVWPANYASYGTPSLANVLRTEFSMFLHEWRRRGDSSHSSSGAMMMMDDAPITEADVPAANVCVQLLNLVNDPRAAATTTQWDSPYKETLQVVFLTPSLVMGGNRYSFERFIRPAIVHIMAKEQQQQPAVGKRGKATDEEGRGMVSVASLAEQCGWSFEYGPHNGSAMMLRYLRLFPEECRIIEA